MSHTTDDVIERMAYAMQDLEYQSDWDRPCFEKLIAAGLRAVQDTHRLVPVEPTDAQISALYPNTEFSYSKAISAAPDYTRVDEDT